MKLDFEKLGGGGAIDTSIQPREIFGLLPKKQATKYQYLRDVQSEVLDQWFEKRNQKDVVIKMNTGGGKTVVGLLLLKSCLNEKKGPVVYIAPDKYLVQQVLVEAGALGLDVTEDPRSAHFLQGRSILITNIHRLINGKSVFGVGEEGKKIPIGSIIIDDAHACLTTTEGKFTLTMDASEPGYKALFALFREDLTQQSGIGVLEVEAEDPARNMLIPFWAWIKKQQQVNKILYESKDSESLQFVFPLIKNHLSLCRCVIGGGEIEIAPRCLPIGAIQSFVDAERRIFMTATLADDSVLVSDFNADPALVIKHITPKTANDIGDRMILIPQELNPAITDEDLKQLVKELSNKYNVVVIVPSDYRLSFWKPVSDLEISTANILESVTRLKAEHVGLVTMANKYDGIDLPYDACRILVIDGLPAARRKIEKIEHSVLSQSDELVRRQIQRIEQGMGRGIRSSDDHCVVFLVWHSLTSQLFLHNAIDFLSPATRAQLSLSNAVSDQLRGKSVEDIKAVVDYCLKQDPKWVAASKSALLKVTYPKEGMINPIALRQRRAFDHAESKQYDQSIAEIQSAVNEAGKQPIVRGWLKQQLAEYTCFINPTESQVILKSAVADNRRVLHPIEGVTYQRLNTKNLNQAKNALQSIAEYDANHLLVVMNGYLDALILMPETSNSFEEALRIIARYIGFIGQRPEGEFGKGPDVLWGVGNLKYFVIECKNGATVATIIK